MRLGPGSGSALIPITTSYSTVSPEGISDGHSGKAGLLRRAWVSVPVSRRRHQSHMRPRAATERRPAPVHSLRNLLGRTRGPQGVHHGRRLPAARSRAPPGRPDSHPPEAHPAPSLIPRRAGEHRETDRRDAVKIARDFRDDRERRIEALAFTPRCRPVVDRIGCFRGFTTQVAMVVTHAWKRRDRLYKVFHRLAARSPSRSPPPRSPVRWWASSGPHAQPSNISRIHRRRRPGLPSWLLLLEQSVSISTYMRRSDSTESAEPLREVRRWRRAGVEPCVA